MKTPNVLVAACAALLCAATANAVAPKQKVVAAPPAFPGAEGAGMYSLGGRGGKVIKVTNLDDAGPGSLRAAIEAKGPRTVVFEISGTITLATPLDVREPRITIAGQTAPGDGITLRNQSLIVSADDVVVRYLRSRLGDEGKAESDAIWVRSGRRIILDHVSASWSVDETLSVNNGFRDPATGFYDVTVQWSLITESLNDSLHVKGKHGYGSLIAGGFGTRISFHHNLWAHHHGRNPRPGNPAQPDRDPVGAFHDYRSNVFYDWGGDHAGYNADTGPKASIVKYNFIDNTYLPGRASTGRIAFNESNELAQAYFAGNTMDGVLPADPWSLTSGKNGGSWRLPAPVDVAPVAPDPAPSAYERVLAQSGASLVRDMVDQRVIASVRERTGRVIDSQTDVSGWPALKTMLPLLDTDSDGMPDFWEREHGSDLTVDDGAVPAASGYTRLEEYLNDIVPAAARAAGAKATVNGVAFATLGAALASLPATGGEVLLAPGEYREKLVIDKPNVTLRGTGARPHDVVIVWGDGAANVGGTFKSYSLQVTGDDFRAANLTIQNDYSRRVQPQTQAVALHVTGDRAVFDNVRLLGAQDTLYAAAKKCAEGQATCQTSRQLFRDCYVEGHVDFIFGDSNAFFERCRIHAIKHPEVMITAHARTAADQDKAYVFDRSVVTADPGVGALWFGRPWRDYSRVIFLNTQLDAPVHPQGWREWTPGKTNRLPLVYYAEFGTRGQTADLTTRDPHVKRLTKKEAKEWTRKKLFGDWVVPDAPSVR
jgi:pectin methylesterase-like acyl-CoA thioesterase/pectate lyase